MARQVNIHLSKLKVNETPVPSTNTPTTSTTTATTSTTSVIWDEEEVIDAGSVVPPPSKKQHTGNNDNNNSNEHDESTIVGHIVNSLRAHIEPLAIAMQRKQQIFGLKSTNRVFPSYSCRFGGDVVYCRSHIKVHFLVPKQYSKVPIVQMIEENFVTISELDKSENSIFLPNVRNNIISYVR